MDPTKKQTRKPAVSASGYTFNPAADPPHKPGTANTEGPQFQGAPSMPQPKRLEAKTVPNPWFQFFLQTPDVTSLPLPSSGAADPLPFSRNLLILTLTLLLYISIPFRDSRTLFLSSVSLMGEQTLPLGQGLTRFAGGQV